MLQFNQISMNKLVGLIIVALLIFMLHRLINLLISKWLKKETQQRLLSVYMPITINFIWIFFFLYSVYVLALINPMISIFISSLILIASWSYAKDFVQGTLFRVQKGNLVGQLIKMDDFSGKVIKMKNTRIHLNLENGEIVEYPYSKLSNAVFAISASTKDYKNNTLSISVPYTTEIEKIKKQLITYLFNIPWIVSDKNIKTEIVYQDSEKINFKISVYTLDEKFVSRIQQALDLIEFE